ASLDAENDNDVETFKNQSTMIDVFANDKPVSAPQQLTILSHTDPQHGTVACDGLDQEGGVWGHCTYTPATDYVGPDSFDYTEQDGQGQTATATVNINVWTITLDGMTVQEQYWG